MSGIYIHEIQLTGDNEFTQKFNYISWLWKQSNDENKSESEKEFYSNEHFDAKYCLEQGLPISFLNEYNINVYR